MKTFFSRSEQKWVSEVPVAYWLGVYDERTKDRIYSDDSLYFGVGIYGKLYQYPFPIEDAREYYRQHGCTPGVCQSRSYRKSVFKPKWKHQ